MAREMRARGSRPAMSPSDSVLMETDSIREESISAVIEQAKSKRTCVLKSLYMLRPDCTVSPFINWLAGL